MVHGGQHGGQRGSACCVQHANAACSCIRQLRFWVLNLFAPIAVGAIARWGFYNKLNNELFRVIGVARLGQLMAVQVVWTNRHGVPARPTAEVHVVF